MDEHEARSLIEPLTREPQPPSRIDVARAMRDGQRRRRTRRVLQGGAVLACACLAVAGMSRLDAGGTTATPVAAAPERFDPLVRSADFGWLPAGMSERTVRIESGYLRLEARTPKGRPYEFFGPELTVTLFPAGSTIRTDAPGPGNITNSTCPHDEQTLAAPELDGRKAQWVYRKDIGATCGSTLVQFRWQYATGAWAVVAQAGAGSAAGGDPRSVLRRIAETLRVGQTAPVRLPFRATYSPAGMHVSASTEVSGPADSKKWRASLELASSAANAANATIEVVPMASSDPHDEAGPVNTTVNGHPAYRKAGSRIQVLRVLNVQGFQVRITASGTSPDTSERVLAGLKLLGPNRSAWTARPLG